MPWIRLLRTKTSHFSDVGLTQRRWLERTNETSLKTKLVRNSHFFFDFYVCLNKIWKNHPYCELSESGFERPFPFFEHPLVLLNGTNHLKPVLDTNPNIRGRGCKAQIVACGSSLLNQGTLVRPTFKPYVRWWWGGEADLGSRSEFGSGEQISTCACSKHESIDKIITDWKTRESFCFSQLVIAGASVVPAMINE